MVSDSLNKVSDNLLYLTNRYSRKAVSSDLPDFLGSHLNTVTEGYKGILLEGI